MEVELLTIFLSLGLAGLLVLHHRYFTVPHELKAQDDNV